MLPVDLKLLLSSGIWIQFHGFSSQW